MAGFITALETNLNAAGFWGQITPAAALIGLLVLVAFGIYVMRRVVKGASRAKARF